MTSWSTYLRASVPAHGAALVAFVSLLLLSGCGSAAYSFRINAAVSRFEEAKTIGAEEKAAYDFYSAEIRIQEARKLAARAEYGAAIKLAKEAEGFSGKAIRTTREANAKAEPAGAEVQPASTLEPGSPH